MIKTILCKAGGRSQEYLTSFLFEADFSLIMFFKIIEREFTKCQTSYHCGQYYRIVEGRFCNTLNWIPLVIWPRLFQKNPIQSNCQGSRLEITLTWSISWHSFVFNSECQIGPSLYSMFSLHHSINTKANQLFGGSRHPSTSLINNKETQGSLATFILKILNKILLVRTNVDMLRPNDLVNQIRSFCLKPIIRRNPGPRFWQRHLDKAEVVRPYVIMRYDS